MAPDTLVHRTWWKVHPVCNVPERVDFVSPNFRLCPFCLYCFSSGRYSVFLVFFWDITNSNYSLRFVCLGTISTPVLLITLYGFWLKFTLNLFFFYLFLFNKYVVPDLYIALVFFLWPVYSRFLSLRLVSLVVRYCNRKRFSSCFPDLPSRVAVFSAFLTQTSCIFVIGKWMSILGYGCIWNTILCIHFV